MVVVNRALKPPGNPRIVGNSEFLARNPVHTEGSVPLSGHL